MALFLFLFSGYHVLCSFRLFDGAGNNLGVDHEQGASILLIIGVNCAVLNYTFPSIPMQES